MNESQIRKLRRKFILISTLAFFIVMLVTGGAVFLFSEITLRNEVRGITDYIIENDGEMPVTEQSPADMEIIQDEPDVSETGSGSSFDRDMQWNLRRLFGISGFLEDSPDQIRTTRYFAVLFDENDAMEKVVSNHISSLDEEEAERYARIARESQFDFGHYGRYYYRVGSRSAGGTIVVYVDRTNQVESNSRILFAVLLLLGGGTLIAFCVMRILSERYLKEETSRAERQKQFITNASHELKTPLSVIRANTEMQEMLEGETEWTASTMRQVDRMSGLIGNLVRVARAQETEKEDMVRIDLSAVVEETADSFVPVAASEGKKLEKEIETPLEFVTDESLIRQLVSLLTDNAVKYCDEGGTVTVGLKKSGKAVLIRVSNHYADGKDVDYQKFFDRFYRADTSHNSDSGGYGIGLSVAENIVKSLGGTLDVVWKEGVITFRARFR